MSGCAAKALCSALQARRLSALAVFPFQRRGELRCCRYWSPGKGFALALEHLIEDTAVSPGGFCKTSDDPRGVILADHGTAQPRGAREGGFPGVAAMGVVQKAFVAGILAPAKALYLR
jgi:hypothetical protein